MLTVPVMNVVWLSWNRKDGVESMTAQRREVTQHKSGQDQLFSAAERKWAGPMVKIQREVVDIGFDSKTNLLIS